MHTRVEEIDKTYRKRRSQEAVIIQELVDMLRHKRPYRRRLPNERKAATHRFTIGDPKTNGFKGYLITGTFDDGALGEIFIHGNTQDPEISGLLDVIATLTSIALQNGMELAQLVNKFAYTRFPPDGATSSKVIPFATSPVDYVFRYLGHKFLGRNYVGENAETIGDAVEGKLHRHRGRVSSRAD